MLCFSKFQLHSTCTRVINVFNALWRQYLVLVGFFQRFNFLLVLIVLGVESINHLQTGGDGRMKGMKKEKTY